MSLDASTAMIFSGSLSVRLQQVDALPGEDALAAANDSSELLLKTVLAADERRDTDESDELHQELKRQDLKLSMILEILAALMLQQNLLPPAQELRFSTSIFSKQQVRLLPAGTLHEIALYIDTRMPRPVRLYGIATEGAEAGWQDFTLAGMSQGLQDTLDKFIFRQHRRLVAAKLRKPQNPLLRL